MTLPLRATRRRRRGLPRDPVQVLTSRLEDEPAVRAWRALGVGPCPARLELLRRRKKSVVYRLPGVGRNATDVIAKRGLWQSALDERAAYDVLSGLPLSRLAYHGFVAEPAREYAWLFVEDAGGEPWDPDVTAHRQASTRWLAALHTASSRTSGAAELPDRGLGWFRGHLDCAPERIRAGFANPALSPDAHPLLDGMLQLLEEVAASWNEIERASAPLPRALVHGDFAERNVRIRHEGSEPRVLAFDWEVAGWGLPAVDLVDVELDTYAEAVRADWPGLDRAALERWAQLGELLRGGVVATSWAAESLCTTWPHDAVREMVHYQRRIVRALTAIGLREPRELA
jgi:hypothetical protein